MIQEIREYITTSVEIPASMWAMAPQFLVYSKFEVWILHVTPEKPKPEFYIHDTRENYTPGTNDFFDRNDMLRRLVQEAKHRAWQYCDDREPIILYERFEMKPVVEQVRTVRQVVT